MTKDNGAIRTEIRWMSNALTAFAFFLPITISLSEGLAFLAIALWVYSLRDRARRAELISNPLSIPLLLFVVTALVVSLGWGLRPMVSAAKFHRLVLLLLVFALGAGLGRERARSTFDKICSVLLAYLAGCSVLGLYDTFRVPIHAFRGHDLFDAGNMRDPQFYLVAVCLLLSVDVWRLVKRQRWWWAAGLLLSLSGVVLHFKRGVWFALAAGIVQLVVMTRRWRLLPAFLLLAVGLCFVPQVRERLEMLRDEPTARLAGRYVLWTDTAPALFEAYPHGIGWSAARHEDFVAHSELPVQDRLNHLHNNFLQIRLELGWPGLVFWCALVGIGWCLLFRAAGRLRKGEHLAAPVAAGLSCAFTGLLLNGLVESNFGTTSTRMLFCFVLGLGVLYWGTSRKLNKQGDAE